MSASSERSSYWVSTQITVEIDKGRRDKALANFQRAGVAEHIDARLADAHDLVKQLPRPFDFVFSDAGKDWYTQYFKDLNAKMSVGGCFTAHNVLATWAGSEPIREFVAYVRSRTKAPVLNEDLKELFGGERHCHWDLYTDRGSHYFITPETGGRWTSTT